MLSVMDTQTGLTVVNPTGGMVRVQRNHPAYGEAKRIATEQALPREVAWQRISTLLKDPFSVFKDWFAKHGVSFSYDADTVSVSGIALNKSWVLFIEKLKNRGGDPKFFVNFIKQLENKVGDALPQAKPDGLTIHILKHKSGVTAFNAFKVVNFARKIRPGDIVQPSDLSGTGTPFMVSFHDIGVDHLSGNLVYREGLVMGEVDHHQKTWIEDIADQPMILGDGRTYKVEEGSPEGWLEDMSTDSLAEARAFASEIKEPGIEVRIVNRLTGETLSGM